MPTGPIVRASANFYYVDAGGRTWQAQARGRMKKEKAMLLVGDSVTIEVVDEAQGVAVITEQLPRRNALERPAIANVDQALAVVAARDPDFDATYLDRLLLHIQAATPDVRPIIVVNKADLLAEGQEDAIRATYTPLGVGFYFTSARTGAGVDALLPALAGKISVLAGPSGSGKSNLLNAIQPGLKLRSEEISQRLRKGRHTTRQVALYHIDTPAGPGFVADTPGFSLVDLTYIPLVEVAHYYPEFVAHVPHCRLPSCLHREEPDCAVKAAIDPASSRYQGYLKILDEIKAHKREIYGKDEGAVKAIDREGGKIKIPRLNIAARDASRRVHRQAMDEILLEVDEEDEAIDAFDEDEA